MLTYDFMFYTFPIPPPSICSSTHPTKLNLNDLESIIKYIKDMRLTVWPTSLSQFGPERFKVQCDKLTTGFAIP